MKLTVAGCRDHGAPPVGGDDGPELVETAACAMYDDAARFRAHPDDAADLRA